MSQQSNELLLLQIEAATAGLPFEGVPAREHSSPEGLWLLLNAAPLSFLLLYRHKLAAILSTLPWTVLIDGPRLLGAQTANEDRKDFWHSLAEEIHTAGEEAGAHPRVAGRPA